MVDTYSLDGLTAELPELVEDAFQASVDAGAEIGADEAMYSKGEVIVMGWSHERRRVIARYFLRDGTTDGFAELPIEDGFFVTTFIGDAQYEKLTSIRGDRRAVMVEHAKLQRANDVASCDGEDIHIGGALLMATLTRTGIAHEELWRWPDAVHLPPAGAAMPPAQTVMPVAATAGMSRQQRRAAERAAAKRR